MSIVSRHAFCSIAMLVVCAGCCRQPQVAPTPRTADAVPETPKPAAQTAISESATASASTLDPRFTRYGEASTALNGRSVEEVQGAVLQQLRVPLRAARGTSAGPDVLALGTIMDDLRPEDIQHLYRSTYVASIEAMNEERRRLAALPQAEREKAIKEARSSVEQALLKVYDRDSNGQLTVQELDDLAFESIPVVHLHGKLSWMGLLHRHLIGMRYLDVNRDGLLSAAEESLLLQIMDKVAASRGDVTQRAL